MFSFSKNYLLIFVSVFIFLVLASCQEDSLEGERCNDVILYDIIKKASKSASTPTDIRQKAMENMQKVFPLARSMGLICTDHQFKFPEFVNHQYCSVKIGSFRCHAIVF